MAQPEVDISLYTQARELALAANAIPGASSCVCQGKCCEASAPINAHDIQIIGRDIQAGRISEETVDTALKRSEDKDATSCPFLTDDNLCSIYDSRPYVCIIWGIGGEPISPPDEYAKLVKEWEKVTSSKEQIPRNYRIAARDWKREGKTSTVPNAALMQSTCINCHIQTLWDTTPIEANEKMRQANRIYDQTTPADKSIIEFVREDLPELRNLVKQP